MDRQWTLQKIMPFVYFLALLLIIFAIKLYGAYAHLNPAVIKNIEKILGSVSVLFAANLIINSTRRGLERFLTKIRISDAETVTKIYGYIIWLFAVLLMMSILIENIGTFVMSLGLIGFGLTFAMQTPISCFVAWIMIVTHKPFKINDRIKLDNLEGDVIDITIMYTVIRELGEGGTEPTGRIVTFPNSKLLTTSVINYTLDINYIWDEISVSVTYESDRELAEKTVKECAADVVGDMMKGGAEEMKSITIESAPQ